MATEESILAGTFIVAALFLIWVAKQYYDYYRSEEQIQNDYMKICCQFDQRVEEARTKVAAIAAAKYARNDGENGDGNDYEGILPVSGSYNVIQKIKNEGYIRYTYHLTFQRDKTLSHLYRISGTAACSKTTHVSHPVENIQEGHLNPKTGQFWWLEETSLSHGSLAPVFGDYHWYQRKNTTVLVTGQWPLQQQDPKRPIKGDFYGVELFPPRVADDSPQSELVEKRGSFSTFELIANSTTSAATVPAQVV